MWKLKLNSKAKNISYKTKKIKDNKSPKKNIETNHLKFLFKLQQERWDALFESHSDEVSLIQNINQPFLDIVNNVDSNLDDLNDIEKLPLDLLVDASNNLVFDNVHLTSHSKELNISDNIDYKEDKAINYRQNLPDDNHNFKINYHDLDYNQTNNTEKLIIGKTFNNPYYLTNFLKLLFSVIEDSFYDYLFNDDDKLKIDIFLNELSNFEQRLYVRLFLRKHSWLKKEKIKYEEFDNIDQLLFNLVKYQLIDDVNNLQNLNEALHCLKLSDLKLLCKNLHEINASTKLDYISAILKHSKSVSTLLLSSSSKFEASFLKKAKSLINQCYRLNANFKNLFMRIFTLASLHHSISDDDFSGQQLIFQMSLSVVESIRYPKFTILKNTRIFADRESLVNYNLQLDLESQMWVLLSKKQLTKVEIIVKNVSDSYMDTCFNEKQIEFVTRLPEFLRPFTLGGVCTRILNRGISALETLKNFELAIKILKDLLEQNIYHLDYRGRWFDRLSLNLDFHLKQPSEALAYIEKALLDSYVKAGHRYDLLVRAKKICSSNYAKKFKLNHVWDKFKNDFMNNVQEAPLTYINGLQIPNEVKGTSQTWLSMNDDSSNITLRVEQLVLQHYSKHGYYEGLHGEGLTFLTLYLVFLWDIVFLEIPDVFINMFQDMPLDFRSNSFYVQRKYDIDKRLDFISSSSCEVLCNECALVWEQQNNVKCSVIHWDLFRDLQHLQGLVKCIGPTILASIFKRMSIDNRHVFGGVPDLIVWNPDLLIFKVVEVKGPNDKLSAKQILWLDYLLCQNVDAEVCHVKAIKRKRID